MHGDRAEMTLHNDPLNHWAASEKYFSNQGKTGAAGWSETDLQDFKFRCGGNVQSVLELALNYGNVGAYEEALQVITRFTQLKEPGSGFPLIFYYQGVFQNKLGNRGAAEMSFQQASQAKPDYCFPFRIEENKYSEHRYSNSMVTMGKRTKPLPGKYLILLLKSAGKSH